MAIRVWNVPTSQTTLLLRCHEGPVTGLSLHPTGDYVLSTSSDKYWAFSDIRTGRLLTKVPDTNEVGLTTAQFHPDGLIFGTGTEDAQVKIWDLKEQSNVANFPGHTGEITAISFSENGYYLATAADDACVKLWDLRKLKNFKTIQLEDNYEVKDLCFDQSGTYLAIAGTDIRWVNYSPNCSLFLLEFSFTESICVNNGKN
jgi:pre-mRNA-processing factor 19